MESYRRRPARYRDPFEALLAAPRDTPLALLCSNGPGPSSLFVAPAAALTVPPDGWPSALARLGAFLREHEGRRTVGWLCYDLRDAVESLPRTLADDLPVPLVHVAAYAASEDWQDAGPPRCAPPVRGVSALRAHVTREQYERAVAAVIEHVCCGDVFQVNLSQPFTARYSGDPRELFVRLCELSPAPFAAYLEDGHGTAILSVSPEELLWRSGDRVRTRPIKGTRPRGEAPDADARLLAELLASEKDLAELTMIVDLLRNDLGKVARPGTVRVGPFPEHASYAQVHHLHATVEAELRNGVGATDLLRAVFPGGSITGAPKLRAMEIIESLEVARRGVYTGAIGWFGPGADLHLNVAIRTAVVRDGRLRFHAGGGITARSDPGQEYEETLHKARGIVEALGKKESDPFFPL